MLQIITKYYRALQNITEYYRVFLAHLLGPIFWLVFVQAALKFEYIIQYARPRN